MKLRDQQLLREYAQRDSQTAFAELSRRYIHLVYSTCRREIGDADLADDVTQAVFLLMAQKADALSRRSGLAGWLFKTSLLAARNARRAQRRRVAIEQRFAEQMDKSQGAETPESTVEHVWLNQALAALAPGDREAVLLRFMSGYTLAEAGQILGLSEVGAGKRIERALAKLRRILEGNRTAPTHAPSLKGREAIFTVAGILAVLEAEGARAVPASVMHGVAHIGVSAAGGVAGGSAVGSSISTITQGVQRTIMITQIKAAVVVCAALTVGVVAAPHIASAWRPVRPAQIVSAISKPAVAKPASARAVSDSPSKVVAGAHSLPRPKGLTLPDRFTLVYSVTNRDVRSQLAKWTKYWDYRHQHFSDAFSRHVLKTAPPETYTLTVSCFDGAMYCRSTQGGMMHTAVYSPASRETVQCNGDQCWVYPYPQSDIMDHLPLPAASMGPMSFLQNPTAVTDVATPSGRVHRYAAQACDTVFGAQDTRSTCTVDVENVGGTSKALNCVHVDYGALIDRWDYYSHEKALGVMLPRLMTDLVYGSVDPRATANKPLSDYSGYGRRQEAAYIYTYKLISASPSPMDANYFTPEGIVKDGELTAQDDPSMNYVVDFFYKAGAGSFDQQAQRAMSQSKATEGGRQK
jgi:RNA polymerase sigma factor (sigma-70 family)